jgi:predicted metal-dependent peptidase
MTMNEIMMKLLIEQPFYGYIASSVTLVETKNIETIKMASIPSLQINYNPVWFEGLSVEHKIGVVMHELLHVILMHQYRRMNREILLWSVACDMAVNEMLFQSNIMKDAITVARIEKKLRLNIEKNRNAEYYYDIITDVNDQEISFIGLEGDSILVFEGEMDLKANKISDEVASSMELNALKHNLAQTIEDAYSAGECPTGLDDSVEEVYKELHVNWRNVLKRFLTGRGRIVVRKSYKRQSRRYDNLPGTKRSVGVNALLAIDESGSISDSLVKEFYQELQNINKITGVSIMVVRFDTQCSKPVPLNKFIVDNKREKRGGTDFRPVFQLADELKMPLVIIFTDGDGEAPVSVNQNTLWVLTKNAKKPADFGVCVTFEG